jgi:protein-disulfide isomerase
VNTFLSRRWFLGSLLLVVLAVAVAGCQSGGPEADRASEGQASVSGEAQEATATVGAELPEGQLFTVGFTPEGHPFKGNPNASVVIEEYSSYQCPFCGRYFAETYPEVLRRYVETGQVLYVFKDFPLSGQPQSPKAAEAALCAGEVGGAQAYWDIHDRLFEGQQEWSGQANADQTFKGYAGELGVDQAAFDDCLDSGRTAGHVEGDAREGMTRGVRGTPSFFIARARAGSAGDDQVLVGAQPISAFASVIDSALTGEPASPPVAAEEGTAPATPDVEALVPTPAAFAFESGAGEDTLLALGDPDAPVILVEFTDYQCPYCSRHSQQTWPTLKARYIDTGRVYYVFKDFPLTGIHPQAPKAHEAARCAAQAGGDEAYWQMHDRLFAGQGDWSGNDEHVAIFKGYASELGLDQAAFDDCLAGGEQAAAVQADLDEGLGLGVTGTPTFFIAGYPFSGAYPIEFFDQAITLAEDGQLRQAIAEAIARALEEQQQQAQPPPTMASADVPVGDAPIKGDPDAPITIVEYSDYQCPFCARYFQETLPQLLENYVETGQVRYVFKDFPLTQIHPQAPKAHEAARCARELGGDAAYWRMHDRLFAGQGEWSGNAEHVAIFKGYAAELRLDQAAFDACLDGGRYAAAVQADLEEGLGFGVTGTPAFFITRARDGSARDGQALRGAQPYAAFEQVIEGLLGEE